MNEGECIKVFEQTSALLEGHFVLTSGFHTDKYVAKGRFYAHPLKVQKLCREIAEYFKNQKPEVVVSPAVGGVVLSQWVAYELTKLLGYEVLSVFAEKKDKNEKGFIFAEGCGELLAGKRVLIVDDVFTTGGSTEAVIHAVANCGGTIDIVGIGLLWQRGDMPKILKAMTITMGIPLLALVKKQFSKWPAVDCPLCAKKIPIDKLK